MHARLLCHTACAVNACSAGRTLPLWLEPCCVQVPCILKVVLSRLHDCRWLHQWLHTCCWPLNEASSSSAVGCTLTAGVLLATGCTHATVSRVPLVPHLMLDAGLLASQLKLVPSRTCSDNSVSKYCCEVKGGLAGHMQHALFLQGAGGAHTKKGGSLHTPGVATPPVCTCVADCSSLLLHRKAPPMPGLYMCC
jgi:hypothetical protein